MRTNDIKFKGINRLFGEQNAGDGSCDELINLRYEGNSLKPCGNKHIIASSSPFFRVFIHRMSAHTNYIGVKKFTTPGTNTSYTRVEWFHISSSGYVASDQTVIDLPDSDDVDLKYINNILVVSSRAHETIYSFTFNGTQYEPFYDGVLPSIVLGFSHDFQQAGPVGTGTGDNPDFTMEYVKDKYNEISSTETLEQNIYVNDALAGMNYIRHKKNSKFTEGYVYVCANFTLYDGTETKPTQPQLWYLGGEPIIQYGYSNGGSRWQRAMMMSMPTGSLQAWVSSIEGYGDIQSQQQIYDRFKNVIKEVNIYCTYPKSAIDIETTYKTAQQEKINYGIGLWREEAKNAECSFRIEPIGCAFIKNSFFSSTAIPYGDSFAYSRNDADEIENEVFYLQKSIPFQSSISDMNTPFYLDFSEAMLTGRVMKVENSGYIKRFGRMDCYNDRLHLFDTKNTLNLPGDHSNNDVLFSQSWAVPYESLTKGQIAIWFGTSSTFKTLSIYNAYRNEGAALAQHTMRNSNYTLSACTVKMVIYTKVDGRDLKTFRQFSTTALTSTGSVRVLFYAMSSIIDQRSYRVDMYATVGSNTYKYSISLRESKSYDFTFLNMAKASGGGLLFDIENEAFREIISTCYMNREYFSQFDYRNYNTAVLYRVGYIDMAGRQYLGTVPDSSIEQTQYTEGDVLTVSAQNNTIVFPPENSYRIGGNIKAIAVNTQGISDVQTGQWPMAAFTDNGIYALRNGGTTMYAEVTKFADEICNTRNLISTKHGIVFQSGDGLYLLSGNRVIKRISEALDGEPDYDIRQCTQFAAAHESDNTNLYDISNYLSAGDFRSDIVKTYQKYGGDSVSMASLSYDQYRDELIVSICKEQDQGQDTRKYSYVYGFREGLWHKITDVFSSSCGNIAVVPNNQAFRLADISQEDYSGAITTHCHTRVMKLGPDGYKSAYRTILRCNVNNNHSDVASQDVFSAYLYASYDMKRWRMIGACQRRGYADILQIAKTSSEYRYFIVSFGGKLSKNSEISYMNIDTIDRFNNKDR